MTADRLRPFARMAMTVVLLAGALGSAGAATTKAPAATTTAPRVRIDPSLLGRLADGPAPALLTFDDRVTSREKVAASLARAGVDATMFGQLSMAYACMATSEDVGAMARIPGAVSIWGNHLLTPSLDKSVATAFNGPPGATWASVTGKGVTIAVLDTGIDGNHPDVEIGRRVKTNIRVVLDRELMGPGGCAPNQYSDPMTDTETSSGHGTHMASVAAGDGTASGGRYKGMAPEADIMGIAVTDTVTPRLIVPGVAQLSLLTAVGGIDYVMANGIEGTLHAKVVLAGWTVDGLHDPFNPLSYAVRDLYDFGIAIVFPVGNEGPDQSVCDVPATCHFNATAAGPYPIAVAAGSKTNRRALANYSSRGDPVERWYGNDYYREYFRYEPLLTAPGTGVMAARRLGASMFPQQPPGSVSAGHGEKGLGGTDPNYVQLTGTSVAAAHVAGTIALMQQAALEAKGCYLTTQQVKEILAQTATPMPGFARWEAGAGFLDATAAVNAARAAEKVPSENAWMCPEPA